MLLSAIANWASLLRFSSAPLTSKQYALIIGDKGMIKILFGVTGLVLVLMALHLKDVVHPLPGTLFMTYFYFLAIGGILHDYSTKRRRLGWSWAVGGTIASVPALYTWWASQTLGKVITGSAWIVCLCSVVAFALFVAVALAVVGQVPEQPRSVRGIGKEGER